MKLASASRVLRTVTHLRPAQIGRQVWMRAVPGWDDASWIAGREAPPYAGIRWRPVAAWLPSGPYANKIGRAHV